MDHFTEHTEPDESLRIFGLPASARLKLLVTVPLLLLVLLSSGSAFPMTIGGLCLLGALAARIPMRSFFGRFSEPAFIAAVIILLKAFSSHGAPLLSLSVFGATLIISRDGLETGLSLAARIWGSVSLLVLLGLTTPFTELLSALSWFRVPRTFVDILLLAHRYIFVLKDDAHVVYQAQRNRLGYAGLGKSLRSFGALTGSVMLRALDQATSTTTALMQRGYEGRFIQRNGDRLNGGEAAAAAGVITLFVIYYLALERCIP